ncbi:hypothetical protein HMPREF0541_02347, partial [Lacticaseibacillus rhamnosus ATCC 21052]
MQEATSETGLGSETRLRDRKFACKDLGCIDHNPVTTLKATYILVYAHNALP